MPAFSQSLEASLHRALELANERKHEYATLEHLLLSLLDDRDAAGVLRACSVDIEAMRTRVTDYLATELGSLVMKGAFEASPRQLAGGIKAGSTPGSTSTQLAATPGYEVFEVDTTALTPNISVAWRNRTSALTTRVTTSAAWTAGSGASPGRSCGTGPGHSCQRSLAG